MIFRMPTPCPNNFGNVTAFYPQAWNCAKLDFSADLILHKSGLLGFSPPFPLEVEGSGIGLAHWRGSFPGQVHVPRAQGVSGPGEWSELGSGSAWRIWVRKSGAGA